MLLRELAAQTPEQREDWVRKVRAAPNGQVADLDKELQEFEQKYGMTTSEMLAAFERGEIGDTPEIAEWLMLANVRG